MVQFLGFCKDPRCPLQLQTQTWTLRYAGGRSSWLIVRPSCASVDMETRMSFSLPRGLVTDHLRARLLCGHVEYLASRLCQLMRTPVFLFFFLFCYFLQPLSTVPKLCTPSVCYPNDENLRPCQQWCYERQSVEVHTQSKKLEIDKGYIAQHLHQLWLQRSSSRYAKEKTVLEREFGHFLTNVTAPKSLSSALLNDIVGFFVRKDQSIPIALSCVFSRRHCLSLS